MRTGVVEWSAELAELFGLPLPEAPRRAEEFLELVHPDDRERFSAEVAAAVATRAEYHFDFRYRHSSGGYRWTAGAGAASMMRAARSWSLPASALTSPSSNTPAR